LRLYVDGRNTRTIRMYTEAQVVADTGADTMIRSVGDKMTRILPRKYVVDDALAGIEFVSALEGMDK
jgi:hypothetical protein